MVPPAQIYDVLVGVVMPAARPSEVFLSSPALQFIARVASLARVIDRRQRECRGDGRREHERGQRHDQDIPAMLPRDNFTSKTLSPVWASKLSSSFCKSASSFRLALTNSERTSAMVLILTDGPRRNSLELADGLVVLLSTMLRMQHEGRYSDISPQERFGCSPNNQEPSTRGLKEHPAVF